MLKKIALHLKFDPKRDFKLITPCCQRNNKDGKFSNYLNLPPQFGYCHSCGKTSLPPTRYEDEQGNEYIWNDLSNQFDPIAMPLQKNSTSFAKEVDSVAKEVSFVAKKQENVAAVLQISKYIPESLIWRYFHTTPENNLLQYLCKAYGKTKMEDAKTTYAIGTTHDGGTVFWNINTELKVQKAKICYYDENGKRSKIFKVPYKNEDGYYSCLFGAHLLNDQLKGKKNILLVESEKTAIVGYLHFPEYIWLAYGGINGLTENKLQPLIGHTVIIIPDCSENAVQVISNKIPTLISLGINAKIWDMTEGKTDAELKSEGIYNNDIEDVFRKFVQ